MKTVVKKIKKKKTHPWRTHQPGMFSSDKSAPVNDPIAAGSMRKNRVR